jgi:hypothetical protein
LVDAVGKNMKNSTIDQKFLDQVTCIDIFNCKLALVFGRCGGDALIAQIFFRDSWLDTPKKLTQNGFLSMMTQLQSPSIN